MRELNSHPDLPLLDHLRDVGTRATSILLRLRPYLQLSVPSDDLARAAFITGICHDFGKAKRQFQEYIHGGKGINKDHAAISSVFTFIVTSQVFGQKPQPTRLLPFVCAYAVNRHHGLLCNLEEAFERASIEHQINVAKGNIDERIWSFEFRYEQLDLTLRFSDYRKQFEAIMADQIVNYFGGFSGLLRQKADEKDAEEGWLVDLYFALLLIVSSLTEADVACVIAALEPKPAKSLDPERVYQYAFAQPPANSSFQQLRQAAWEEIQECIKDWDKSALRLTLPTGIGKTLMGLYLGGQVQQQDGPNPVVYSLPYLSIIEQTTKVVRSVFPQDESGVSVVQHHSLSFPTRQTEEIPNFEQAQFALENWDADLVVTTFDQLFYSFLSSDRGFIRRFFRLPGSVFLLDEVQTIPARLIPAVEVLLQKLRQKLDIRIIYMTATHPPFLQGITGLVRDEKMYFRRLERTRLHIELEPVPFSDYISQLSNWLLQRKGKKVLLVANTTRSARDLFVHLRRLRQEEPDFRALQPFHLSGSIVPVERLQRIRQIQELTQNNPKAWVVVVSTQCVEAGVDLDMDEAVRDFAPWDSLLQVCGRVNRFGKKPCADVWVYQWIDDANKQMREFHSYIYDSVFTDTTLSVFANRKVVSERDYWKVQQAYVQYLEKRLSGELSKEILRSVLSWKFDELGFQKLFRGQEEAWKISVFCVADKTAEVLKEVAIELWASKDPREAIGLLEKLCSTPDLFGTLQCFLNISGEEVKNFLEDIKKMPERSLRFRLGSFLKPFLQAYTISLSVRNIGTIPLNKITEDYPYLTRERYLLLAGETEEEEGKGDKEEFFLHNIL